MKGMENLFKDAAENESLLTTEQALAQANSVVARNVPPFDLNAKTPQAAYPLSKIITSEEWESMDVTELQAAAKYTSSEVQALRDEKVYPEFILNRLKRLRVEVSCSCGFFCYNGFEKQSRNISLMKAIC